MSFALSILLYVHQLYVEYLALILTQLYTFWKK
jgi:hypothetical protein